MIEANIPAYEAESFGDQTLVIKAPTKREGNDGNLILVEPSIRLRETPVGHCNVGCKKERVDMRLRGRR